MLQQLLFYNYYFSPAWFVAIVAMVCARYGKGLAVEDEDQVRTAVLFLFLVAEPARLWAGYTGNLRENVSVHLPRACVSPRNGPLRRTRHALHSTLTMRARPFVALLLSHAAASRRAVPLHVAPQAPILLVFWLLTLFISVPIAVYLAFGTSESEAYDKALNTVAVILLAMELLVTVVAVSRVERAAMRCVAMPCDAMRVGSAPSHPGPTRGKGEAPSSRDAPTHVIG